MTALNNQLAASMILAAALATATGAAATVTTTSERAVHVKHVGAHGLTLLEVVDRR